MAYPGGKSQSGVYQSQINQIPPHDTFISAFVGNCGVLKNIRMCRRAIAIDLDPVPLDWWARARPEVELYNCDSITWLRHHFGLDRYGTTPLQDATPDPATGDGAAPADGSTSSTETASPADAATFVYADPPYLENVRSGGSRRIYRHEQLTTHDHERILQTLVALPRSCAVMICGISCSLYNEMLSEWRTIDYSVVYRSGRKQRETAWMNYGKPPELHDYRYLGENRREREKFNRRRRHLQDRLDRLPVLEKLSLIDAALERR